jgi:nucleotide-binding universal stress UspA family protein
MKKILVPCDFSSAATEAYKFALDIATANAGEVLVLNVNKLPNVYGSGISGEPYSYIDPVSFLSELTQDLHKQFDQLKNSCEKPMVPVHFSVKLGAITDVILETIHEQQIDLVVIGTAGASGMKEFFIGSNTEKIVRFAPVPVFAVHKAQELSYIKNIVFPTTFDLNQSALIDKIKSLQTFFNAELHVLHIKTRTSSISDHELMINLENFGKFYGLVNYSVHIWHQDSEQQGILNFAKRLENSMIAMATHGHKGIAHLLMGSIAEDVVNHAQEQVWTYASHEN